MKLSELRGAIRKMKGNPSIVVELTPGVPMTLVLQKTPTLETLGAVYEGVTGDIGLSFDDTTGIISGPLTPSLGDCPDLDAELDLDPADEDDEDML